MDNIWAAIIKGVCIAIIAGVLGFGGLEDPKWWGFMLPMNIIANI